MTGSYHIVMDEEIAQAKELTQHGRPAEGLTCACGGELAMFDGARMQRRNHRRMVHEAMKRERIQVCFSP